LLQKLTITGLGASSFTEAMAAMHEVSLTAEREFKQGTLEQWAPTMFHGFEVMESMNRYFKRVREGDEEEALTIVRDIDPKGMLQRLVQLDLAHTEENVVHYFSGKVDGEGKRRYIPAKPQLFRIGDIIEMQVTLESGSRKGEKMTHRMKLILRAIVLLDERYTQ
ncbi:hypothetical protein EV421DRAFT_1687174, partial [Armillaria borealis]